MQEDDEKSEQITSEGNDQKKLLLIAYAFNFLYELFILIFK